MSSTIVNLIRNHLGPGFISQFGTQSGENESGISKAISVLIPIVLGGLANRSNDPQIVDSISNSESTGLLSNLMGNSSNSNLISNLLSNIFGDKMGGVVSSIANYAGISDSSSSSLLNMVTGASVGSIGQYATENNLGASGISQLLNDQKGVISNMLPAGLSLASLGLGNWFGDSNEGEKFTKAERHTEPEPTYTSPRPAPNSGPGMNWLKWLIPLALLFLIAGYLLKKCSTEDTVTPLGTEMNDSLNLHNEEIILEEETISTARVEEEVDLKGTKLKAYQGGLEGQLISYLNSGNYDNADDNSLKDTWYTFDNVNFKMGSSDQLEEGSARQLDNLVAILKAFPTAKIKIGGYTDSVGDAAKNKALSQSRADYIQNHLAKAGVGSQVLSAEGYGSEFATVPAEATDAERAVDRKMAIRFAK